MRAGGVLVLVSPYSWLQECVVPTRSGLFLFCESGGVMKLHTVNSASGWGAIAPRVTRSCLPVCVSPPPTRYTARDEWLGGYREEDGSAHGTWLAPSTLSSTQLPV